MIIYNEEFKEKVEQLKKKDNLEEILLQLEKDLEKEDSVEEKTKELVKELREQIEKLQSSLLSDDNKKYLAQIILEEKPTFTSNSLILSPVGSGKTTLINEVLMKGSNGEKSLFLVSTRFLKDSFVNKDKERKDDRNTRIMTYHEFGLKIRDNYEFVDNFSQIFCDEIHSLPEYSSYDSFNKTMISALDNTMRYLFNKQANKEIFYFTATDASLKTLQEKRPNLMKDISVFDYRDHPEIKKYMEISKSYITHIEQIRPILRDRIEGLNYFKYKGLVFSQTIKSLKVIEKVLIEEGLKPLVLWSDSNEEYKLTPKQIKARKKLITTGLIPDEYDFLLINSAMREGWDLKDNRVRLAIMNTTSEIDIVQARGRIRKDIDLIVFKTAEDFDSISNGEILEKYLNKPLTPAEKDKLCYELDIRNSRNQQFKWTKIKKILENHGYKIRNYKATIDGSRHNCSYISKNFLNPEDSCKS